MFDIYLKQSFLMVILFSGIPLIVCSISALIVSVIQAATQVQEQTITYLVRFSALSLTLAATASWFSQEIVLFIQEMIGSIAHLGGI